jgi:hypothetical protein
LPRTAAFCLALCFEVSHESHRSPSCSPVLTCLSSHVKHGMFFLTNRLEGRERKIRWSSSEGGQTMCADMCTFDLAFCQRISRSKQAGRTQGFHNHVRRPSVITSTDALLFCSNSSCSQDC